MKSRIISAIKIILPLSFGVFLIWLFYDALCEAQKEELFTAFGRANYFWVILALFLGWLSHLSRAYRWKYLLEPMGYKIKFWNAYHAVMIGYITNLIFPRAGEASRAVVLSKTENVPFQKGFGSIIAERAVDLAMLGIIVLITLGLQFDKIDLFRAKIDDFNSGENSCANSAIFSILGKVVLYGIFAGLAVVIALFILRPTFREKLKKFAKGIFEGIFSIFKTKSKGPFLAHTFFIWIIYILWFWLNFFSLEETSSLGIDAILAGFIAGAIGIVLVQGGIGVYPAFVGLILTVYLPDSVGAIAPEALALGWIAWTSQTIMVVILGLISLALNSKNVKFDRDESAKESAE
ncbi:flippase-like domain-containing protein [Crocinitomix catalasitica]|nr:flippase-like domain-containing protein [Crocinitomix catalasitica]